jgi:hypothetical protein
MTFASKICAIGCCNTALAFIFYFQSITSICSYIPRLLWLRLINVKLLLCFTVDVYLIDNKRDKKYKFEQFSLCYSMAFLKFQNYTKLARRIQFYKNFKIVIINAEFDRLCGLVVRVLGYRSGGPGSIPGTTRKKM